MDESFNPTAVRTGGRDVLEEATLIGPAARRMFTVLHLPASRLIGGVVICSPLHAEFAHNYRREVLIARDLAMHGVAVQRFHYVGTGNSDGDSDALTWESMQRDAHVASDLLRDRTSVEMLSFLGTRMGAFAAVGAAARFPGSPLALWEPCLDAAGYFRDIVRHAVIRDVAQSASSAGTSRPSFDDIEQGSADILGYSVGAPLYASFAGRHLRDELATDPRELLLIQLDRNDRMRAGFADLIHDRIANRHPTEARAVRTNESWWFLGDPADSRRPTKAVVDATSRWLLGVLGSRSPTTTR